jgi:hypothetical protein
MSVKLAVRATRLIRKQMLMPKESYDNIQVEVVSLSRPVALVRRARLALDRFSNSVSPNTLQPTNHQCCRLEPSKVSRGKHAWHGLYFAIA